MRYEVDNHMMHKLHAWHKNLVNLYDTFGAANSLNQPPKKTGTLVKVPINPKPLL